MKKKIFQENSRIVFHNQVKQDYFKLTLRSPRIPRSCQPGQFVMLRLNQGSQPLLRRPFSIHKVRGKDIEIIYEVVGEATKILSQAKFGEYLDVIGPLGSGFNYELAKADYRLPVLIAGGMGVAPLTFLAERLKSKEQRAKSKELLVLIGANTKDKILCEKEFKELGCAVKIATDDGSKGFKGKVTELLKNLLYAKRYTLNATIYACGPRPMLKEISRIAKEHNFPAQISLEEHMGCGFGACFGCAVNTQQGYQRVCKDGPVFDASTVLWE